MTVVSMKDIAQKCGVSVATVSKALNGQPDISESTRERISRTAEEMGYFANSAARALKTKRTYNLGVLFVDERQSGLTHEFFSAVLDSFKVEAESWGYDITFINRNVGGRPTTYLQHCLYRGVDGVAVACVDFRTPQVAELINSNLPVVTIDHVFDNHTAILSDNIAGMDALLRYVYSKGHRRIAFVHGEMTSVTENRIRSFYRTCAELGLEIPDEYIRCSNYHDPDGCAAVTAELLALPLRPSCIMFPDDISYMGGYRAITEAGLRIPQDISATGYDGIKLSKVINPRPTTYRQDTEALGREAARRLIALIENPKTTLHSQVMIGGFFQEGDTVAEI